MPSSTVPGSVGCSPVQTSARAAPYTVQIILLLACARPKSLMLHANGQHSHQECLAHFSTAQGEQDSLPIDADTARAQPSLLADHVSEQQRGDPVLPSCQVGQLASAILAQLKRYGSLSQS